MSKALINCECNSSFFFENIKLREEMVNNILYIYYLTPCCKKKNIVAKKDKEIRDLEARINKSKPGLIKNKLLKEYKERMDNLNAKETL
ncbi:MAG: hypothetical protein ACRDD7_00895 [Peptostreptococcaceae bacterium]